MGKIKRYYPTGNTSLGFYNLIHDAIEGLERLYILKGGPGTGKSSFMKSIGSLFLEKGYDVEYLHCSLDQNSLDGVLIPAIKLGFVDGTAPHVIDPKYPGAIDQIINLGDFWNAQILRYQSERIIHLMDAISDKSTQVYEYLSLAKKVHEQKEKIYISAMNFERANQVTLELIDKIFPKQIERDQKPKQRRMFFGATTYKGAVNFIEEITEQILKRYIIKGRSGSGKSTMLKRIAKHAYDLGLSVEVYLCGFDPNSLDMIVIPSLQVAILDGTAPHVVDPTRESDKLIDMFTLCIDPQIELDHKDEIKSLDIVYRRYIGMAISLLQEIKQFHDELEEIYISAMDFDALNQKKEETLNEVLKYAEEYSLMMQ